jgi:hypothetical protein
MHPSGSFVAHHDDRYLFEFQSFKKMVSVVIVFSAFQKSPMYAGFGKLVDDPLHRRAAISAAAYRWVNNHIFDDAEWHGGTPGRCYEGDGDKLPIIASFNHALPKISLRDAVERGSEPFGDFAVEHIAYVGGPFVRRLCAIALNLRMRNLGRCQTGFEKTRKRTGVRAAVGN